MAAPPIALAVTAVDKTANAFDRVNTRIEEFSKRTQARIDAASAPFRRLGAQIERFSNVSGLTRVASAFRGVARAGADVFERLSKVVPLIGIIGGAASIAGITRMVAAWTDWGSRIGFAATRIGMSASSLAVLGGAARLAGSSAASLAGGMQALGQTMYDAIGGRNAEALVMFRTLGIEFHKTGTQARSVADVLPEVADKIAAIKDPYAQAQAAATLFGSAAESLLPFLRRGSQGIREYTEISRRYLYFSDASAASADRLRVAQTKVSLAVDGLRNRIAERLEPILTPLLTHFADWIATSPQVARGVAWLGTKVSELGAYLEGDGFKHFLERVESWGTAIDRVVDALGGPEVVIGGLIALMVGSFALKVIAPFIELGAAILSATVKLGGLLLKQKEVAAAGGAAAAGKGAGLGGALLGGLGADQALRAVDPDDKLGAWIDRNIPGAAAVDNFASKFGFGRSTAQQAEIERARTGAPQAEPSQPQAPEQPAQRNPNLAGRGVSGGAPRNAGQPSGRNAQQGKPVSFNSAPQGGGGGRGGPANAAQWAADRAQLQSLGWSREQASGILGNLDQESGGNQRARGDGGAAFGLAQWHADRQANFAKVYGHSIQDSTHAEQVGFVDWELHHTEKRAGDQLAKATSTRDSAAAIRKFYERPANVGGQEDTWRGDRAERMAALPEARGAPMQMASNENGQTNGRSTVRVEFGGKLPQGLNMRVDNPQRVEVGGPLVERPQLLGANA